MQAALRAHDEVLRSAIEAHEGSLLRSLSGDRFVATIASPMSAVDAATSMTRSNGPYRATARSAATIAAKSLPFTVRTLADIEQGVRKASPGTYAMLENKLAWAPGSIDTILAGGEPTRNRGRTAPPYFRAAFTHRP